MGVGAGVRGKSRIAAGPDSLESEGSGDSGLVFPWPEWPGSKGEETKNGQGSSLAGAMPCSSGPRRWTLCHLWTTQGSVQAWAGLRDSQAPHQRGESNLEVSQPPPREQRVPQTQPSPPLDLRGEAPRSSGPSQETGLHAPGDRSPCQTAALLATLCMCPGRPGPSQAWARTWAQPGLCLRAPAVSPARAGAGPALFALSQPGPCVPDPRASGGREGIREVDGRVEAGRGSRCKVGGGGGRRDRGRTAATPARK